MVTSVYWMLGNIAAQYRSTLASIYLSILIKADDTKKFGYQKILEPLLIELQTLQRDGVLVPGFEKPVKGTVVFMVADNLGAHSVAGFVENFTGSYICRYCLAHQSEIQSKEVRCGGFQRRTKEQHTEHVQTALSCPDHTPCYGVKKLHFHVTSGYPPDVLHDILEGIVPVELAFSIDVLIKKRYISLVCCWCLLRLLPVIIGLKVPEDEPVWQMLMTLKDIMDLAMSPIHTEWHLLP